MKTTIYILFLSFLSTSLSAQQYKKHSLSKDRLSIDLSEGILNVIPLTEKSIRIQYQIGNRKEEQEFVLINKRAVPAFAVKETVDDLELSTKNIIVTYNKKTGILSYSDKSCLLYTSPSPRDATLSRMPSSA